MNTPTAASEVFDYGIMTTERGTLFLKIVCEIDNTNKRVLKILPRELELSPKEIERMIQADAFAVWFGILAAKGKILSN